MKISFFSIYSVYESRKHVSECLIAFFVCFLQPFLPLSDSGALYDSDESGASDNEDDDDAFLSDTQMTEHSDPNSYRWDYNTSNWELSRAVTGRSKTKLNTVMHFVNWNEWTKHTDKQWIKKLMKYDNMC